MKKLLLFLSLISFNAFADWQTELTLGIDGETFASEKMILVNAKESSIPLGRYLLKLTITKSKEDKFLEVSYALSEKTKLVAKGKDEIEDRPTNEIFAKGEKGQPNTIITLKMKSL